MPKIQGMEFTLRGDPSRAKAMVQQALESRKFTVHWEAEWSGTAERGNKVANALAGALAQYFKVGTRIMSAGDGNSIVRIERQSSGWMGGAIGAARTARNLEGLRHELSASFQSAGVLVLVNQL
jgi:hypothetical protein